MADLIASYRTSALGYDAPNTRLLDESGNGNHLPLLAGTPDFTGSYSGKTGCWNAKGDAYFGGANLLHPACFTVIAAVHCAIAAGESEKLVWASGRVYADTDPGHQGPALQPFEDGTFTPASLYAPWLAIRDADIQVGTLGFAANTSTGFSAGNWNIAQFVWNGETSQIKARIGTGAWTTTAITNHYQVAMVEELRLGYRPTNLGSGAGAHLGCLRIEAYVGDWSLDNATAMNARITALAADPAL